MYYILYMYDFAASSNNSIPFRYVYNNVLCIWMAFVRAIEKKCGEKVLFLGLTAAQTAGSQKVRLLW